MQSVFLPYRLVAAFADGERLYFDGITEAQAKEAMEAAQSRHGDITWYDGVTDIYYDHGRLSAAMPEPPEIHIVDIS